MIDEAEVRQMSPADRQHLARLLARIDGPPQQGRQTTPSSQTTRAAAPASPYLADPKLHRQRRLFAELPLAFLAFAGARRLLKATIEADLLAVAGSPAPAGWTPVGTRGWTDLAGLATSLRRAPLSGHGLDEALPFGDPRRHTDHARP